MTGDDGTGAGDGPGSDGGADVASDHEGAPSERSADDGDGNGTVTDVDGGDGTGAGGGRRTEDQPDEDAAESPEEGPAGDGTAADDSSSEGETDDGSAADSDGDPSDTDTAQVTEVDDGTGGANEREPEHEQIGSAAPPIADVPDSLVEAVPDHDPETLAGEIHGLRAAVDDLEADRDEAVERAEDLESRLKRKQADFENYKKRQDRRREEERRRATEDLVRRLLDVRDNLQRALDQDEDVDIRDGVASTLRQFDDVLEREDVEQIAPSPGETVDPERHEVLSTVEAEVEEGTIADCYRPGYAMGDTVIRPAQVTVAE